MTKPSINRVAVIGAGISGVEAAAHLFLAGLEVTVFERNRESGGVWVYDDKSPIEPIYPSVKPSQGEHAGSYEDIQLSERILLEHAPPGACYVGLKNNVPTSLLQASLNSWPKGTPDFVPHSVIKNYIQETSLGTGVHDVTVYGAKVTHVQKLQSQAKWLVTWTQITEYETSSGKLRRQTNNELFDAVVVASGHYHAPRVPDIPGLSDVKQRWPSRVLHSKGYRKPEAFANKNVLLIGGATSSTDIASELGPVVKSIYQSTRNGKFDIVASILPANAVRVAEIASFEVTTSTSTAGNSTEEQHSLPVTVHLKSDDDSHETISGIDYIIICTGYHFTLPFLNQLHEDETPPADASDTVLVTDGTQVHNLHKDIFYIPDPTLSFIGIPFYVATFSLYDFQAMALAAVYSGVAQLPPGSNMREEYQSRVQKKGFGRSFHSLRGEEEVYVKDLLEWVNFFRAKYGLSAVRGHSEAWVKAKEENTRRLEKLFANAK